MIVNSEYPKRLSFMQPSLQGFFLQEIIFLKGKIPGLRLPFMGYGIEYRGTSHGTFGCFYHSQKVSGKSG